jgi:hypothetical protein
MPLDVTPGCPELAVAADAAVGGGDEDCFDGVADHELIGLLCAWDRLEAHMAARKLAVAAELFRRNPEDGVEPSPGAMPEVVSEFAADQLACALAVPNAGMIIGSSSGPGGRPSSSPTAGTGGRPRPGGATTPSRRGTPSRNGRIR